MEPGIRAGWICCGTFSKICEFHQRHKEQVVLKLRQIEVPTTQGKRSSLACKEAEISERSSCRWRREYGGLQIDQARTMKDLERENARLRRLVADLSLEKQVLADVAAGNLARLGATPAGRRRHQGEVWSLRSPCLPNRRPAPGHATLRAGRRGCADPRHRRPRVPRTGVTATAASPRCCGQRWQVGKEADLPSPKPRARRRNSRFSPIASAASRRRTAIRKPFTSGKTRSSAHYVDRRGSDEHIVVLIAWRT